jgi:hypothetical protein
LAPSLAGRDFRHDIRLNQGAFNLKGVELNS